VTLGLGKQRELPRRQSEYRSARGDMNQVPRAAADEAEAMKVRQVILPTPTPPPGGPIKRLLWALGLVHK